MCPQLYRNPNDLTSEEVSIACDWMKDHGFENWDGKNSFYYIEELSLRHKLGKQLYDCLTCYYIEHPHMRSAHPYLPLSTILRFCEFLNIDYRIFSQTAAPKLHYFKIMSSWTDVGI